MRMLLSPGHIPRLAAIAGLFTRYGLTDFATRQGLRSPVSEPEPELEPDADVAERARGFRKRLVEMGPAYVKLGQVLSTRPDLIPEAYITELAHLQDDVGEIPFSDVEETIQEELGGRVSKLFASFEREPLGTASLGQVHAATLRDGRSVVVKVQRPHIRESLADDIEFFRELARFLTAHTEAGERLDMVGVIHQLERALVDELDYLTEARNAAIFRRSLAEFPRLLIPRVIEGYTTHRVLTTERIIGVKISAIPPVSRTEHDLAPLAEEFARGYLKQITVNGHFHADPHPGNVFIVFPERENPLTPGELIAMDRRSELRPAMTPLTQVEQEARELAAPALEDPHELKLALIDFGMTARLTDEMRDEIVRLLLDMSENRGEEAAETLAGLGDPMEDFDRRAYTRDVAALLGQTTDRTIGDLQTGIVMYELINISFRHGLRMPAELTLLAKALFNLDAVSRSLDPTFSPIEAIRDYTTEIANERARRTLSPQRLYRITTEAADLVGALPRRLDEISRRLADNEFSLRVDTPQLPILLEGMQKIANRIFTGLALAGLLVASGLVLQYWRVMGLVGFLVSGALALWMVVTVLISDRRKDRH